jgi:hypothetical protein
MRKINDPVFVVDADGVLITAAGIGDSTKVSIRSDNPEYVKEAKEAADIKKEVPFIWGVRPLKAGWDTEEGILAALLSVQQGRSYVLEAPEEILAILEELQGPHDIGIIY